MAAVEVFHDQQFKAEWAEFAEHYVEKRNSADDLNLLNDFLVSGRTGRDMLVRHPDRNALSIRDALGRACLEHATFSTEPGPQRVLNDAIVTSLVEKWISLISEHGLYPPHASTSISAADKKRRAEVLNSVDGMMIAEALNKASMGAVWGGCALVRQKLHSGARIELGNLEAMAMPVQQNTLFRFDDSIQKNREKTAGNRYKNYLIGRVKSIVITTLFRGAKEPETVRMDAAMGGGEDVHGLHNVLEDTKAVDPSKRAEGQDQLERVAAMLEKFAPREREVMRMRFGLDSGIGVTLDEVARNFGITRERVRQIELKVLTELRSRAEKEETPSGMIARVKRPDSGNEFAVRVLEVSSEPWGYESVCTRKEAVALLQRARGFVLKDDGVRGEAAQVVRGIEEKFAAVPPLVEAMGLLRVGNMVAFNALLEEVHGNMRVRRSLAAEKMQERTGLIKGDGKRGVEQGVKRTETKVEKKKLKTAKLRAAYRCELLGKEPGDFDARQAELLAMCEDVVRDGGPLLLRLIDKLQEVHCIENLADLAAAACNSRQHHGRMVSQGDRTMTLDMLKKAQRGQFAALMPDQMMMLAEFALEGKREGKLYTGMVQTLMKERGVVAQFSDQVRMTVTGAGEGEAR